MLPATACAFSSATGIAPIRGEVAIDTLKYVIFDRR
jgi:hypothetical protein